MINIMNNIFLIYIIILSMVCPILWTWDASHFDILNEPVNEVAHEPSVDNDFKREATVCIVVNG
jgi:hypothetical protein